jgi:hypothetical protein
MSGLRETDMAKYAVDNIVAKQIDGQRRSALKDQSATQVDFRG